MTPQELVNSLRSHTLRTKTGILLIKPEQLGDEGHIALRLGIQLLDYTDYLLDRVPDGGTIVNLSLDTIVEDLDVISNRSTGMDCVLLSNFDIAVTKLTSGERSQLWKGLMGQFPNRRKGLIFCMPARTKESEQEWSEFDERIVEWDG